MTLMTRSFRAIFAPVALAFVLTATVSAEEPGYVDFGKLIAPEKGQFVEINLGKGLLKLASFVVRCEEPAAADVISGISRVRINVVGLDDRNRDSTTEKVRALRTELNAQGWDQIVTARGEKHEDVAVFIKHRDGEVIDGLVVTVIDERKKEAVLVNIAGRIKAEQLGALGERFQIDPLKRVKKTAKL
jgi:hypothetical protein